MNRSSFESLPFYTIPIKDKINTSYNVLLIYKDMIIQILFQSLYYTMHMMFRVGLEHTRQYMTQTEEIDECNMGVNTNVYLKT